MINVVQVVRVARVVRVVQLVRQENSQTGQPENIAYLRSDCLVVNPEVPELYRLTDPNLFGSF